MAGACEWDFKFRFIGVANYFCAHVPVLGYSVVSAACSFAKDNLEQRERNRLPIVRNRLPIVIVDWDDCNSAEQVAVFKDMKEALSAPEILNTPRAGARKRVETDVSGNAIGVILLQLAENGTTWQPIAFLARKLKPSELRYSVTKKD